MTETAKERIYRERLELIADKSMWHMNFKTSTIKTIMKNAKQALVLAENLPASTDELSADKLEDHLMPYSKEMIQKIRDEKMQLVTAEEFVKLHQEKLAAVRDNDKLQKQLNTAKNLFKDILDVNPSFYGGNSVRHLHNCVRVMRISADKALAALEGGDDE
ncbi:hypothetical protein [Lactococcus taiwanensis]|uniref:hypothetical protein n=1 Tax=Lactococcus taiwanensis TaxID=1151742 RepID=UPI0019658A48|nr:hypothetical protein [Lactococcus taiwanensis]QRZ11437.1 hypothetical protein JVB21_01965 [Lactococcus taiwanensis]